MKTENLTIRHCYSDIKFGSELNVTEKLQSLKKVTQNDDKVWYHLFLQGFGQTMKLSRNSTLNLNLYLEVL